MVTAFLLNQFDRSPTNVSNMDQKIDEEFNNFMHKVNQVSKIVHNLASEDKNAQELGQIEADEYLGTNRQTLVEQFEEESIVLKVKNNKTVVNKMAFERDDSNTNTMSKEAFMEEISRDADRRYKDKLIRQERMETFKKRATKAFRNHEYEKALSLYNKAIEQIKDCCLLYNNRALTYINLNIYDKAKEDLETALKLNEDCLKSWLLLAKVSFLENNTEQCQYYVKKAIEKNPERKEFIQGYENDLLNRIRENDS